MPEHNRPALSAIFITPDDFETIRRIVQRWSRQTVADRIEALIVHPRGVEPDVDEGLLDKFHSWSTHAYDNAHSTAAMRVVGIRAAAAAFIAITEDHCFPTLTLAEHALEKFAEGYDAVGGAFRNANPRLGLSWVNLLTEYSDWMEPVTDLEPHHLPGHNSLYRRELLLEYGECLTEMFESESVLHWDMAQRFGSRLALLPSDPMHHLNFSLLRPTLIQRYWAGLLFGADRARGWPLARRVFYVAASPLIPFVRYWRTAAVARRLGLMRRFRGLRSLLFLSFVIDGVGQLAGYAGRDPQGVMRKLTAWEFKRERFMCEAVPPLHHRRANR